MSRPVLNPHFYKLRKAVEDMASYFGEQAQNMITAEEKLSEKEQAAEQKLVELQDQITALGDVYKEKKRVADLDLNLAIRADKQEALNALLSEFGKEAYAEGQYDKLVADLKQYKSEFDQAVAKVRSEERANYAEKTDAAVRDAEATYKVQTAELIAKLAQKDETIERLKAELDRMGALIEKTNETAIRMVESVKSAPVTVNTTK